MINNKCYVCRNCQDKKFCDYREQSLAEINTDFCSDYEIKDFDIYESNGYSIIGKEEFDENGSQIYEENN